ncbi:MAG: hypothetical protein ABW026_16590, partial [Microvirga sp.]
IQIQATHGAFTIDAVRQALGYRSDSVRQFVSRQLEQTDTDEITLAIERISHEEAMHIAEQLRKLAAVKSVSLV